MDKSPHRSCEGGYPNLAKRTDTSDYSKWVKVEPEVVEIKLNNTGWPSTSIVLMKSLKLNITGAVTGVKYTWDGAGSVVDVDNRDVPAIMHRAIRKTSCCGTVPTPYFVILG